MNGFERWLEGTVVTYFELSDWLRFEIVGLDDEHCVGLDYERCV